MEILNFLLSIIKNQAVLKQLWVTMGDGDKAMILQDLVEIANGIIVPAEAIFADGKITRAEIKMYTDKFGEMLVNIVNNRYPGMIIEE